MFFAAYKNAVREQRLAAEISAAKKERDFYLSKVDQSRAINSMEERKKKVRLFLFDVVQMTYCMTKLMEITNMQDICIRVRLHLH